MMQPMSFPGRSATVLLLWVVLAGVSCSSPSPEPAAPGRADPAEDAPDFEVKTFDGRGFSFGEQRGTPVVLNFWESW